MRNGEPKLRVIRDRRVCILLVFFPGIALDAHIRRLCAGREASVGATSEVLYLDRLVAVWSDVRLAPFEPIDVGAVGQAEWTTWLYSGGQGC